MVQCIVGLSDSFLVAIGNTLHRLYSNDFCYGIDGKEYDSDIIKVKQRDDIYWVLTSEGNLYKGEELYRRGVCDFDINPEPLVVGSYWFIDPNNEYIQCDRIFVGQKEILLSNTEKGFTSTYSMDFCHLYDTSLILQAHYLPNGNRYYQDSNETWFLNDLYTDKVGGVYAGQNVHKVWEPKHKDALIAVSEDNRYEANYCQGILTFKYNNKADIISTYNV